MKFHGELDQLKGAVEGAGFKGKWTDEKGHYCFRAQTGEVLNWYKGTGTLQVQGKGQEPFRTAIEASLAGDVKDIAAKLAPGEKKIFIVHGHDRESRDQLELILMRLGLNPFILQNADGGSKTIIEALEHNIYTEFSFEIVLMTPDDYGYPKDKTEADRQARARQNVIPEMGMVMASLGRSKMAILKKGNLEIPSDADGIIRLEFNDRVQEVVPKLVQRLQAAGFVIDPAKIAAASA